MCKVAMAAVDVRAALSGSTGFKSTFTLVQMVLGRVT